MSKDYYLIDSTITRELINQRKDMEIVKSPKNPGRELIKDKYGNYVHIVEWSGDNLFQMCRYGVNNSNYILDSFIKDYNALFYSDDGVDLLLRINNTLNEDNYEDTILGVIKKDMEREGYFVDRRKVTIPIRTEKKFNPNLL